MRAIRVTLPCWAVFDGQCRRRIWRGWSISAGPTSAVLTLQWDK